jgi:hypothetical protein
MPRIIAVALITLISVCATPIFVEADTVREASFEVNTGVRQDNMNWDILGWMTDSDGTFPAASELEWDELDIYEIGGEGRVVMENGVMPFATCLRIRGAYGSVYDGEVRDSDYTNKGYGTFEFSRSISDSDDGDTLTLNAGIGPQFYLWGDRLSFAVLVGYNYHEQNLTISDGTQVVAFSDIVPVAGTYMPNLDSSYDATWEGAWIGVDAALRLGQRLIVEASLEVQDVKYEAEADWNLRTDLAHPVSFEHDADGICIMTSAAVHYLLNESWALSGNVNYGYMFADDGKSTFYRDDGGISRSPLEEVEWDSIGATLGLRWIF